MTSIAAWHPPQPNPALGADDAAIWWLSPGTPRPVETVAARYLGAPPEAVRLARTPTGKPELEDSAFAVSLAHSADVVLVAIASGGEIGVDVEVLCPDRGHWTLVEHALTQHECARLGHGTGRVRAEAFLRVWTRKEAILKAAGTGLGIDPRRVELEGLEVVALPEELGPASAWTLADVPLPGYAATLACRGALDGVFLYDARR